MLREVLAPTDAQVEAARRVIADYLTPTPTVRINVRGRQVFVKLESLQVTGAFKIRGALAALHAVREADATSAVITSSAGNHGLGIAHAAGLLDVRATVVVPANASAAKVAKLRKYDVELIQIGSSYDDAQAHALELADRRSLHYVSPFNDTNVIAGQATVFAEMIEQAPDLEHLVVSVGGGGLLSGTLLARAAANRLDVRLTGVQPEESSALYHVLRGAKMSEIVHRPTIADGLAGGGDDGAITNALIARAEVPLVLVPEREIRAAVAEIAEVNGLVMEGSAAAAYAAITTGLVEDETSRLGFIASGRNISLDLLSELLAERASR
ncbi:MAG: pyridoxal-phosphate dependent enzyme [Acidobacteriota bacterium]|nr:pyridoxal-phosphate dependent enzyme [Acidobacteriota bacterium]MDE3044302.1 pyridoxal-phosphate dependent enzyme [Acidobacteriota bacterium]MDE3107017.1 pyridoxal-phosphate dependent enzyme [Acidobacteriota bacterium]MDE3222014.1 pyridoxal-phosphate dependent enzyme [Acidobacteriota bacterium]